MIIDVSVHNGTIDWAKVKPYIEGAIIRCGYGSDKTSQDDKQWKRNADECTRLGIPFGVYLYSYAGNTAQAQSEAQHVLRLVKGYNLALPIFFDAEESKLAAVSAANFAAFAAVIKAAGHRCGLYTGEYFFNAHMKSTAPDWLWIAKYGTNTGNPGSQPRIGRSFDLWQYTSRGSVPGVASSGLDCSQVINQGIFTERKAAQAKSDEEIAKEVLAGAWGNGDDRKARLTAADYNYSTIQTIVNRLCSNKKSNEELAKEVLAGKWGNGRNRVNRLKAAGYDPEAVQTIVNALCR